MNNPLRLLDLLDLFDRLVASASVHLSDHSLEGLRHAGERMRRRRHFAGVTALVGLAGGTGSGKSSLLNALAGTEVALGGVQRPTTSRPLVLVPHEHASLLENLWAEMGISDVETSPEGLSFALVDLPDLDSLDAAHREQVEKVLLDLDVVVWVTDPEKYRDRVLHDRFLRPLRAHEGRFLFVLNQIDRLSEGERDLVVADFEWALRQDGYSAPTVVAVAADPPLGPPLEIESLLEAITRGVAEQGDGQRRIEVEMARQLESLDLDPIDFNTRWGAVRARAASTWPSAKEEVVRFFETLQAEVPELADLDSSQELEKVPPGSPDEVARYLDATIGRAVRERLRPRAQTRAIAIELQLALNESL